ncbi:folate-sensitive fragile site protein Fra10Ac1-domain-containing protein [Zopfochytrium polystomum]|nr:folate-sensitive fragile site protein Fra10Ac1-domain-containing protein [Zopfochytrium polystomum]
MNDYFFHYNPTRAAADVTAAAIGPRRVGPSEIDILKKHHRFLHDDTDLDPATTTWEQRIALRYYNKLFKEYCIADIRPPSSSSSSTKRAPPPGAIALRWRTQREVVSGFGQFVCGNLSCATKKGGGGTSSSSSSQALKSWEVNFAYVEDGVKKNALVKLRLCGACGEWLAAARRRGGSGDGGSASSSSSSKRAADDDDDDDDVDGKGGGRRKRLAADRRRRKRREGGEEEEEEELEETRRDEGEGEGRREEQDRDPAAAAAAAAAADASRIWTQPLVLETEKTREEEMDEFFADLLG